MRIWLIQTGEPVPLKQEFAAGAIAPQHPQMTLMRTGRLAEELTKRGHSVTWWTSQFSHREKRILGQPNSIVKLADGSRVVLLEGSTYSKNVSYKRYQHHRKLARSFCTVAITTPPPDLILASLPTHDVAYEAMKHARQHKIPFVVDVRDTWPDAFTAFVSPPLRPLLRLFLTSDFNRTRKLLKGANAITASSEQFLAWGLRYAGREQRENDRVLYIGARPNVSDLPTEADLSAEQCEQIARFCEGPTAVFVGSFGRTYDLDCVLETARALKERSPLRFLLIGDGEQYERVRTEAEGLENVHCTGWLSEAAVAWCLSRCDVGLAPYIAHAPQTMPNKPFEYMAARLPVISSLTGELEQLLAATRTGLSFPAGDANMLALCLEELTRSGPECRSMGARARELFAKQFDAESIDFAFAGYLEHLAEAKTADRKFGT